MIDAGGKAEDTLVQMVQTTPDAVVVVDAEGVIRYWNAGAERLFGFSVDAAVGHSLDLIIPEPFRKRHWEAFHAAVSTGSGKHGPDELLSVPAIRADGLKLSVEFTVALLGHENNINAVGAIIRDVTERRARESELRNRLRDLDGSAQ
ncbi:MAG TPA: PAS domain S-box protein [Acidimicrobiales bacterium]|nr:PAS domain S-box protein [Acidimicrobiales bacterium]